ncbi:hypothetical protein ABFX02_14G139200 [Erythranthe guttata]
MKRKSKESDDVRKDDDDDEEEEEARKKIWDCGSPLYDSYELVAINSVIERHFMIFPYLGGSRKVTAQHQQRQLCLNSSPPPRRAAAGGGGGGGGGKSSGVSLMIEMLEGLALWKRNAAKDRNKNFEKR